MCGNEPCAHERDYTTTQAMKSYVAASVLAGDAAIERDKALATLARVTHLIDPETAMAAGSIGSDRYFCESDIRAALDLREQAASETEPLAGTSSYTSVIRGADGAEALTERQLRYADAMVLNPQMTVERAAYALLDNVLALADAEHAALTAEIENLTGLVYAQVSTLDDKDAEIERLGIREGWAKGANRTLRIGYRTELAERDATIERLWTQLLEAAGLPARIVPDHNDPALGFDKTAALSDPTYEGVFGATPKRGCPCGCSGPTAALSDPGEDAVDVCPCSRCAHYRDVAASVAAKAKP